MKQYARIGSRHTMLLLRPSQGQGLVEYGLILGLVVILLVSSLVAVQSGIEGLFSDILAGWP